MFVPTFSCAVPMWNYLMRILLVSDICSTSCVAAVVFGLFHHYSVAPCIAHSLRWLYYVRLYLAAPRRGSLGVALQRRPQVVDLLHHEGSQNGNALALTSHICHHS